MADTLDLITLAEAKSALNNPPSDVDTELAQVITAVSQRLDDLCGAVVIRTVTSEAHDGGCPAIFLRRAPVSVLSATTITTLTEYSGTTSTVLTAETVGTTPSTGYLFVVEQGTIFRRSGGSDATFPTGRRNVVVTYQGGRYANTGAVAPKFKQAAAIAVAHVWTNIGAGSGAGGFSGEGAAMYGIPPWDIPKAALLLLGTELRPPGIA